MSHGPMDALRQGVQGRDGRDGGFACRVLFVDASTLDRAGNGLDAGRGGGFMDGLFEDVLLDFGGQVAALLSGLQSALQSGHRHRASWYGDIHPHSQRHLK